MITTTTHPLPVSPLARIVRGGGGGGGEGGRTRPGLLLAHGAGGGIAPNFGPVLDGLAERYTVVGPDYPGTGGTPRATEPLDPDILADQLVATAVEEGLDTFAIAAYSMGVPLAIRATTRHPDRVRALVLTAGFAAQNPRLRLAARAWLGHLQAMDQDPDRIAAFLALIGVSAPVLDALDQAALDALLNDAATTVPPGTADHVALAELLDVRADLPAVRVPTLVISTTLDQLATPYHHHQLADGIPESRLTTLESGHLPFVERPKEWLAAMRTFLDEVHDQEPADRSHGE
ncbi:alpha/beta fold hydrolase [Embleya sp. AB8]|uniref:alpha/beta fold hydrolase n=1 Tax=Embleya sp. AB8 TaxID=3156304 RepID=UPI003C73C275